MVAAAVGPPASPASSPAGFFRVLALLRGSESAGFSSFACWLYLGRFPWFLLRVVPPSTHAPVLRRLLASSANECAEPAFSPLAHWACGRSVSSGALRGVQRGLRVVQSVAGAVVSCAAFRAPARGLPSVHMAIRRSTNVQARRSSYGHARLSRGLKLSGTDLALGRQEVANIYD